jgi:hypothetical protein
MASISKTGLENTNQERPSMSGGEDVGSPITNEAYDLLTALQSKLEGLEAYRKYSKDAKQGLWAELSRVDRQGVDRLVDELEKLVREGGLRERKAGSAKA